MGTNRCQSSSFDGWPSSVPTDDCGAGCFCKKRKTYSRSNPPRNERTRYFLSFWISKRPMEDIRGGQKLHQQILCTANKHWLWSIYSSFSFLRDEESFRWGFNVFKKNLGESPSIIFTDSDSAMKAAIAAEWPEAIHRLCIFHLFKNFYEHCRKVFAGRELEWSNIARRWWRLCKKSDSTFVPDLYSR